MKSMKKIFFLSLLLTGLNSGADTKSITKEGGSTIRSGGGSSEPYTPPSTSDEAQGMVFLTIAGEVQKTNRSAYNENYDSLMKVYKNSFEMAFEFDMAMLETNFEMAEATVIKNGITRVLSGPRLADVLNFVGCTDEIIYPLGIDKWQIGLTPQMVNDHNWIIATKVNGKRLNVGGKGPLWLAYDANKDDKTNSKKMQQVGPWGLFFIHCGPKGPPDSTQ